MMFVVVSVAVVFFLVSKWIQLNYQPVNVFASVRLCVCVRIGRYREVNPIHNVIYFRIALKTTVQRHILVSFSERARSRDWQNEKRLRDCYVCATDDEM